MNLESTLQIFSFDGKEAGVYLAALELGTASIYELSQKTSLKRPTTYLVVDGLRRKGVLSLSKIRNKTYFTPLPPKKLFKKWENNLNQLNFALHELENRQKNSKSKPFVQFFRALMASRL